MARKGRMCVVAGCDRRAASGSMVCTEHHDSALGEQMERELRLMTQRMSAMAKLDDGEEKRQAHQAFRRQVMRGDYAAIFSSEMVKALNDEGGGYGMKQEIGMMRLAMLRLMLDEEDPSRLAIGLARLSGALGKAMERQGEWEKQFRHKQRHAAFFDANQQLLAPSLGETAMTALEESGKVVSEDSSVAEG